MSTIAGPLVDGDSVRYRRVLSARAARGLQVLIALNILTGAAFIGWLLWPSHLPRWGGGATTVAFVAGLAAFAMMLVVELIRLLQSAALWLFASKAEDPVPLKPQPGQRVAVLTTIVPSKEPVALVLRTLRAMKAIEHDGVLDVWLLDEGNDPHVREACEAIGVKHFSRKGVARWNTESGPFKAKTKAGNHNAWRDANEHHYDVVAQMDPDHVPGKDFLTRTLGYFRDPDVGFVVAPQVYGNINESWIAHGAAVQAYVFHGVIQRGGNGMEAPLLIGTNHLYRPATFAQIGGYQDSIIEDHLTSMAMYAQTNPDTGNRWKGVYTPDIVAVGEGPTSFTDYFNQQKRWAYGIWEIAGKHSRRMFSMMRPLQRLSFTLLQFFYPSVAISWILGNTATAIYLFGGDTARLPVQQWVPLWVASMAMSLGTFFWLRRFNLVDHERRELGLAGLGLFLACLPVYVSAACAFIARKPLAYAVTAKGDLTSPDTLHTFRSHLVWVAGAVAVTLAALCIGTGFEKPQLLVWTIVTAIVAAAPIAVHAVRSTDLGVVAPT